MDNIKIIEGKIYESQDVEIDLAQLEQQYTDKIAGIEQQQEQAAVMKAKIDFIKSQLPQQ